MERQTINIGAPHTKGHHLGRALFYLLIIMVFSIGAAIYFGSKASKPLHNAPIPDGYTLEVYTIEKTLNDNCSSDRECTTPASYLAQSRCPFVAICENHTCQVVCPSRK